MSPVKNHLDIFGGSRRWNADAWTSSDDRVRGGKSRSHLDVSSDQTSAHFYGTLDFSTLGGAGFASQRTVDSDSCKWDLTDYAGIKLDFAGGDKKRYTFNVKDTLLPPDPATGREQSTISWECDFELPPQSEPGDAGSSSVYIPWDSLTPTYRGRVRKDVDPLDIASIKRFSIMIRSFFGTQQGDFSLRIDRISAQASAPAASLAPFASPGQGLDLTASKGDSFNASHLERGGTESGGSGSENVPLSYRTRVPPMFQNKAKFLLAGAALLLLGRIYTMYA